VNFRERSHLSVLNILDLEKGDMTLKCFPQGAVNTTVRWRDFQTFASMPRTGEENLKQRRQAPHHDKTLVESLTDSAPCA